MGFGIATFLIAYFIGTVVDITQQKIEELRGQFLVQIRDISLAGILINNMKLALDMFIPGFGIGLGLFSGFSTGMTINAVAEISPPLKNIETFTLLKDNPPLIILITPFGILEIIAYGIALSRSGLLAYQLVTKRIWRKEYALVTLTEIGIVIAILLFSAIMEWQTIVRFGEGFRNSANTNRGFTLQDQ